MKRAVIADDTILGRTIVRRCLDIAGAREWEFSEARDGREALAALTSNHNLLVTDLHMPNMDGLELVRRVRSSPRLAHIPIIVVTSGADVETRAAFERYGARVLSKPISPAALADTLASLEKEATFE